MKEDACAEVAFYLFPLSHGSAQTNRGGRNLSMTQQSPQNHGCAAHSPAPVGQQPGAGLCIVTGLVVLGPVGERFSPEVFRAVN